MKISNSRHNQSGAIHALIAIMLLPLIACMALAVDGFLVITSNLQQNNTAEYAAIAAMKEMRTQELAGQPPAARLSAAITQAEKISGESFNNFVGRRKTQQVNDGELSSTKAGTVRFGRFAPGSRTFIANAMAEQANGTEIFDAVEVRLNTQAGGRNTTVQTIFAGVMGAHDLKMQTVAYACFDPSRERPGLNPYVLCKAGASQDATICDMDGNGQTNKADVLLMHATMSDNLDFLRQAGFTVTGTALERFDTTGDGRFVNQDILVCTNLLNRS